MITVRSIDEKEYCSEDYRIEEDFLVLRNPNGSATYFPISNIVFFIIQ